MYLGIVVLYRNLSIHLQFVSYQYMIGIKMFQYQGESRREYLILNLGYVWRVSNTRKCRIAAVFLYQMCNYEILNKDLRKVINK
jgi:hypothetical protein